MLLDTSGIPPRFLDGIRDALSIRDNSLPADSILPPEFSTEELLNVIKVPASCGLLTEWELEVTGSTYDATDLVQGLAAQKFTAVALLNAFRKRASIAQQLVSHVIPF